MMEILGESNVADPCGFNSTLRAFRELNNIRSILEIGYGAGANVIQLARNFPNATIVGIDTHKLSLLAAENHIANVTNPPKNVKFELRSHPQLNEPPDSYDIITSTFVNHHIFPDEDFVNFLRRVAIVGKRAFIFSDFHRTGPCFASVWVSFTAIRYIGIDRIAAVANLIPSNLLSATAGNYVNILRADRPGMSLMIDGGILSMKRSFSLPEYGRMFQEAGYPPQALSCRRMDKWYDFLEPTCRVVCTADLTWAKTEIR